MRDHVAICFEKFPRLRAASFASLVFAAGLVACSQRAPDPVETFATTLTVDGERPASVSRSLQRGVYLLEARERDIDARVTVTVHGAATLLEDRLPRHGVIYKVVSLGEPDALRVDVASADHRSKRGEVIVRISRFARDVGAAAGESEAGYSAQTTAAEIAAHGSTDTWARVRRRRTRWHTSSTDRAINMPRRFALARLRRTRSGMPETRSA
jgi:hypothetical protein